MTRRLVLTLFVLVGVACSSDSGDGGATRTTARDIEGLSTEGVALVRLMERGTKATYHAVYRTSFEQIPEGRLEVWRRGDRARADSVRDDDVETSTFRDGKTTTQCSREAGVWTCRKEDGAIDQVDAFVALAADDLRDHAITETQQSIAGQAVRCFAVADSGGVEICATAAGVPARLNTMDSVMELTSLDTDVPASVFKLPA